MNRRVLLEMTVHQEQDVFKIEPVAAVSSKETENLENKDLRDYVLIIIKNVQTNYQISEYDMAVLIKHHCSHRTLKKAALLAIPYVLNANMVTASWKQKREEGGRLVKGKDRKPTGMVSAPILIDGTKYLCSITTKKNAQNVMIPYALVLKDANMNIIEGEKMVDSSNVPHSSNPNAALGQSDLNKATTSHESPPSFQDANLQQNNNTTKENNQENINCERNMNKNRIRLTESQLHKVIKESVKKVLNEIAFGGESLHGNNPDDWSAMAALRNAKINHDGEMGMYDDDDEPFFRQTRRIDQDNRRHSELCDKMYPNDYKNKWADGRNSEIRGYAKGLRMAKNLGLDY